MGLKEEFLEKVKSYFPDFNEESDKVVITFDGGGDNFNSFYKAKVTDAKGKPRSGEWDCDRDMDFLFLIMDQSKVFYHWVSCTMNGTITYANKRLWVTNQNCNEPEVWVDSYDEDGNPLDGEGEVIPQEDLEWDCDEEKGSILGNGEEDYETFEISEDGFTPDEEEERKKELELSKPLPSIKISIDFIEKKKKPSQKKNGKKVVKKITKKVAKKKTLKKVIKKKPTKKVKKVAAKKTLKKKK